MHAGMLACMHTYMHACIHTCIHTCMHTYMHTHIQALIEYIHTIVQIHCAQVASICIATAIRAAVSSGSSAGLSIVSAVQRVSSRSACGRTCAIFQPPHTPSDLYLMNLNSHSSITYLVLFGRLILSSWASYYFFQYSYYCFRSFCLHWFPAV